MTHPGVTPCRWTAALLLAGVCAAPAAAAELPTDLDLVPRDAAAFFHFRAADIWNAEWMADARHLVARAGPEAVKSFREKFAPDPSSIERLTLVMLVPQSFGEPFPRVDPEVVSALVIVRTQKPYDRLAVLRQLGLREKLYRRHLYYFNEDLWSGLALIDAQTFVVGSEDALVQFFDRQRSGSREGPLQSALEEAVRKHQLVIGLNPRLIGKEDGARNVPPPLQKLLEARCVTTAIDLDKDARLNLRIDYDKADDAQEGEKALRTLVEMGRQALAMPLAELEKVLKKAPEGTPVRDLPENFAALVGLGMLRELDAQMEKAPIKRDGSAVVLDLQYKGVQSTQVAVVSMAAITSIGVRAGQTFTRIGSAIAGGGQDPHEAYLKKLAEGLNKYEQEKGSYPAPAIYDADGRALLSWRVALLPYLGEEGLYKEFHLNEPWDSLHNKKLLKKLPQVYRAPNAYSQHKTTALVFTGAGAAFSGKKGPNKGDIGPGAILLADVDSTQAVWWSKPADLSYAEGKPLPPLFGKYGYGQLHVLLGNGTHKAIAKETDEKTLREMIRRSGTKIEDKKEEPKK